MEARYYSVVYRKAYKEVAQKAYDAVSANCKKPRKTTYD